MREILFKAKRADNGEWVTGYYIKSLVEGSVYGYIRESRAGTDIKIMLNTLCQYTGLTDKNGNKIWENDVVKVWWKQRTLKEDFEPKRYKAVVEFGNPNSLYSWGWQLRFLEDFPFNVDILLWIDMDETGAYCEVIGNIFDNKELLEV